MGSACHAHRLAVPLGKDARQQSGRTDRPEVYKVTTEYTFWKSLRRLNLNQRSDKCRRKGSRPRMRTSLGWFGDGESALVLRL